MSTPELAAPDVPKGNGARVTHPETQTRTPMTYHPFHCLTDESPYDLVEWKTFHPTIKNAEGAVVFEQADVEAPATWSDLAVRIVAEKYFHGQVGTPERETSVRQLVNRVVSIVVQWVYEQGYFKTRDDVRAFGNDLAYLILTQKGTFNSPVWFNLGVENVAQQCSACFIQGVEDTMESIAELQYNETMVFKRGSGSGTNFSRLRSRKEHLQGGGVPSGPVSFMGGLDSWGGVIKSGGTTRRAAKMCGLDVGHPDIMEFIDCKLIEEKKARALIDAGFSAHFDDDNGAYASVKFQNANHSVRVPDVFMRKLEYALTHPEEEILWDLRAVTTGEVVEQVPVKKLWDAVCSAAWACGDPGIQFDTTTNTWHTCPSDGKIRGSNPCSEYVFLDDTSCNLASLNLLAFQERDGSFAWEEFRAAVTTFIIAQDALVQKAHYPTAKLTENTRKYHTLGLGFANLGAYLMTNGLAYNSSEGRRIASEISSEMTATAYRTSASIAAAVGTFEAYDRNRAAMLEVLKKHRTAASARSLNLTTWDEAIVAGEEHGFRNAQVTVLAPTGTIAFMMDCATTGCEPELSLHKVKYLVGGGEEVLINPTVEAALGALGYNEKTQAQLLRYLERHKTLEGSALQDEHLDVFDCAIPSAGDRVLGLNAHLRMAAALQPFLSGAISKTMNVPNSATVQDMSAAYLDAWRMGLKSITVYRDGCKQSQPVQTRAREDKVAAPQTVRRKLNNHQMNTHRIKLEFGNIGGYILSTPYEDTGMPGEVFVKLAKEGSTISGLVDGWALALSFCLQYGVPLETLVDKFSNTKFEPAGYSSDADIQFATSIYDAVMRKLAAVFLDGKNGNGKTVTEIAEISKNGVAVSDAPACHVCGTLMVRSGASCHSCPSCGASTGCG